MRYILNWGCDIIIPEKRILVVEDETIVAEDIRRTLHNMGYAVPSIACSGEEALKKAEEISPDLVLMDIILQGKIDGVEAAGQITSRFNTPVIYLTAHSDIKTLERAKITEPFGYIIKPFKEKELKMAIEIALFKHGTEEILRASETKYRTLLENIPQKIFHKDINSTYVSCNNNYVRDLKIMPDEIAGKTDYDFFSRELAEKYRADDKRIMESGKAEDIEEKYVLDGQEVTVHTVKTPIIDDNGNTTGVLGIFWDITERKKSEQALRESEDRYRRLVDFSPFGIVIHSGYKILYANLAAIKILGAVKPEDLIGEPVIRFVHPDYQDIFKDRIRKQNNGEIAPLKELKLLKLDGTSIDVEIVSIPFDYLGIQATYAIIQDITERKRAEEEIQYRSQIQTSLNNMLKISLEDIPLDKALEQVIDQLTSINWLSLESRGGIWLVEDDTDMLVLKAHRGFPPSLQSMCSHVPVGRCICGRAAQSGKLEFADSEDERHENAYQGKRKQAEEALSRSNEFSRTILDSMNDALCIIDTRDFKIAGFNSVFLKEFEQKGEDIIGKTCYDVTHSRSDPCKPPDDACPLLETVKTGKHSVVEHLHHGENGKKMYVEISTSPILDEKGRVTQVVHVSRDITERKLAEERLKQVNIELKRADELKTQFLSVVSHELRTPITPMNAQLQMILAGYFGDVTENQRKSLEMIRRNTTRLNRLIGDVLDISKLEAGVMKFNMTGENLNEIVENAVETMKIQAWDKNLKLTLKEDKIPEITIDKDRITQVIINLINNAIKFTEPDGIIEVELSGNTDHAIVKVKDNGIGIKKEDQQKLFTPFQQVDSSYARRYEGTGLGLAICKRIVTYHGGKIWGESEPGKGSIFQFTIPYSYKIKEEKVKLDLLEKLSVNRTDVKL